jgi:K+-transporting ATPase ATPase C chain
MLKEIRPAVVSFLLLTLLTGIAYPMLVTGISQATMPDKANGSLIMKDGKPVGSSLIGQSFSDPKYFWSRPSATGPMPNNASSSGGSNLGPTNPALMDAIKGRVQALRDADPGNTQPVPVDLVTASASGLDPHISPAAAEYQLARVARLRILTPEAVRKMVAEHTEGRQFGILGEPRVNVLELNLALDTANAK